MGRNDSCPCGSKKKFKKCCIKLGVKENNSIGLYEKQLQFAQSCVQKGEFLAAEPFFREAIRLRKQSAIALAGLGQCLCQLTRSAEGVPYIYKAGQVLQKTAQKTGDCKDLLNLAYQLIHWHAPHEALSLAKAAWQLDSGSANANYIVALGLQGLNRIAEAYKYATRAVAIAPLESNAIILLATLEAKLGHLLEAKQRLDELVLKGAGSNQARALLELGGILDKLGEFDQAFQCLSEAAKINSNSQAVQRLDAKAVYRDIAGFQASFDASFLSSTADRVEGDGLPGPVFLLGFYRSGTTLAEQVLSAHAGVITSDEAYLLPRVLKEVVAITELNLPMPEKIKSLTIENIKHLRKMYWQLAGEVLGKQVMNKVLVDKTAMNTLNLELINVLFPGAVVIFAVRDPRDVCLSCFMQPFSLSPLTMHFLSWQGVAKFYKLIMEYWLSIRENLSLRWIELRYEDVVNDLEGQFRPVFEVMGLEWDDECARFYQHSKNKLIKTPSFSQVTQPIYSSSTQRWRGYEEKFDSVMSELEVYIKQFGYEL